jgi:hypothetical protein
MSVEMLESTYGHHHPDHYGQAVNAMNRGQAENAKSDSQKQKGDVKVVEAQEPQRDTAQSVEIVGGGRSRSRTRLHPQIPYQQGKEQGTAKKCPPEARRKP